MPQGRTQAVLIGGAFNGILSALPFIGVANLCCCLWVMGGGAIAAWLMQQGRTVAIRLSDGAIGGALAGLAGAFFYTVVTTAVQLTFGSGLQEAAEALRAAGGDVPVELIETFEALSSSIVLMAMLSFFMWLVVGGVFSTIGGLLGALFFRRAAPPAAGAPVVPPPPPETPIVPPPPTG